MELTSYQILQKKRPTDLMTEPQKLFKMNMEEKNIFKSVIWDCLAGSVSRAFDS